jgi:hypothetical protein
MNMVPTGSGYSGVLHCTVQYCSSLRVMLRRRIRIEIIGWIQVREKRMQIRITRVDIKALHRGLYFSLGPYFPPDTGLKKCPSEHQKKKNYKKKKKKIFPTTAEI